MNEALELMRIVESRGGRFILEGAQVFIEPEEAALPIVESLRARKLEIRSLLQSRYQPQADPEQDSEALLSEWMLERCVFRDRSWTPIAALHLDCSRWRADRGLPVVASRLAFVDALRAQGFTVAKDGSCNGLLLKEDWKGHEAFQAAPEHSKPPARVTTAKRRSSWCSG
jgi:hypothetical protein